MNKTVIFISFIVSIILFNFGISTRTQIDNLQDKYSRLKANNLDMKQEIGDKSFLVKRDPILLSTAYEVFMNQVKVLEGYTGTNMNVQLDGVKDTDDISRCYISTKYKGVRGLKIEILVNKFSQEADIGALLDDIHLLEKNTDFVASEINKEYDNLIVKGEVYGI